VSDSPNLDLVRSIYAAWERGDFSSTDWAFDPEVEFARLGRPDFAIGEQLGEWRGLGEMRVALLDWMRSWENIRIEAERVDDLGDRVLVLSRQSGRGKRSGVPLDFEYGDIFTIRNGKIVRWELYLERADALAAAALSE
jgi:ketosteroid isomerase-like protein